MAFTSGFLRDDSLVAHDGGCELHIRLPWMRALPFSALVDLRIRLDNVVVPIETATFSINGELCSFESLAERWSQYWSVRDRVSLLIPLSSPILGGQIVDVEARASLRIVNLVLGSGTPMVVEAAKHRSLVAQAA